MGGANRLSWPRRGSLQIWPRKRSKRIIPRLRNYKQSKDPKFLAFIGYKAGMTHIQVRDNNPQSLTNSQLITIPATIIDCPPIKPLFLRFYKKTTFGLKTICDFYNDKKKDKKEIPKEFDDVRVVIQTQPKKTSTGQKKPNLLEVDIGGSNEEKLKKAQELFSKEININEIFDEGQILDVHAVTKGKGFQGTVKRFGVKIRQHKSEKTKRGVGTLGAWTPKAVSFRVAQPGKMGFHQRTEYNKQLLKIAKPEEVNQKGGILHYGNIKNDCILIKGSIPGPAKMPIVLTEARRQKKSYPYEIIKISTSSKQGR